jgi:hypothetical protein
MVREAANAVKAGYGARMMLEMSPDRNGVLAPVFPGCEVAFVDYRRVGCTFLVADRCELYGTGLQPLECRYCHHDRPGKGPRCHAALEKDWDSAAGRALVVHWAKLIGFWEWLALGCACREMSWRRRPPGQPAHNRPR